MSSAENVSCLDIFGLFAPVRFTFFLLRLPPLLSWHPEASPTSKPHSHPSPIPPPAAHPSSIPPPACPSSVFSPPPSSLLPSERPTHHPCIPLPYITPPLTPLRASCPVPVSPPPSSLPPAFFVASSTRPHTLRPSLPPSFNPPRFSPRPLIKQRSHWSVLSLSSISLINGF